MLAPEKITQVRGGTHKDFCCLFHIRVPLLLPTWSVAAGMQHLSQSVGVSIHHPAAPCTPRIGGNADAPPSDRSGTRVPFRGLAIQLLSFTIPDHGRPQNLNLSRRDGMDALAAQPREGDLTTRRFPLSGVLGTVRA